MTRQFNVPVPPTGGNLYALILAITGAVPPDSVLPDRWCGVGLKPDPANTQFIIYKDTVDPANNAGDSLEGPRNWSTVTNSIDIRTMQFTPVSGTQSLIVYLTGR